MYLGVIALWRTVDDPSRAGRAVAILTLVGAINLPIIKFSVDWWNTLHQPASVMKLGGAAIHPTILYPLLDDGARVPPAVRHAAHRGDAQRDPAPPRAHAHDDEGAGRVMIESFGNLGPHAHFILIAYGIAIAHRRRADRLGVARLSRAEARARRNGSRAA